jgi:hypothetical protein
LSIVDLVDMICKGVGYKGGVTFHASRTGGVLRR